MIIMTKNDICIAKDSVCCAKCLHLKFKDNYQICQIGEFKPFDIKYASFGWAWKEIECDKFEPK